MLYAVPEANVALFETCTVQFAADAVTFDTTMPVTRFTVPDAGVSPVSEVAPLYVQATDTAVEAGST